MVAHDSRQTPEPRPLSDETAALLSTSISARLRSPDGADGADEKLRVALVAAAKEARDRGLRPEELIVALKKLEDQVANGEAQLRRIDDDRRRRVRETLVSACLDAYFAS